jgi:hypothetical protein
MYGRNLVVRRHQRGRVLGPDLYPIEGAAVRAVAWHDHQPTLFAIEPAQRKRRR